MQSFLHFHLFLSLELFSAIIAELLQLFLLSLPSHCHPPTHLFTSSTSQSVAGRRAVVRTLDAQRRTACSVGEMPFAGESIVFFSLSVTTSALPDERTANYLSAAHSHAHNLSTVQFTFRLLLQFSVFMFICPSDSVQQHHSIAIYQCIN